MFDRIKDFQQEPASRGVFVLALVTMIAIMLFTHSATAAETAVPFRLCTGGASGNYVKAGHILKREAAQGTTKVDVQVIETKGSMDNLDKVVSEECDGAFVQNDALLVYESRHARALSSIERVGGLYREYVHLICNRKANIDRVTELTKDHTVAIGPEGGGAAVTWDGFVIADKKKYGPVQTSRLAGVRALAAVQDGSNVQCMIYTAGLNSEFIKTDAAAAGERVTLVKTNDGDFDNAKDSRGRRIYEFHDIPGGTYKGIMGGWRNLDTVAVEAVFIVRTQWVEANEKANDSLLRARSRANNEIKKLVGQK